MDHLKNCVTSQIPNYSWRYSSESSLTRKAFMKSRAELKNNLSCYYKYSQTSVVCCPFLITDIMQCKCAMTLFK